MARKRDREGGGHPLFWLLLGFLCGVMATLGALLMLSGGVAGEDDPPVAPPVVTIPLDMPDLDGAPPPGGPVVLVPPPSIEPAMPIQEPVVRPTLPTFRPQSQAPPAKPATAPRPPTSRSSADQMAEDAAAAGMTARTR